MEPLLCGDLAVLELNGTGCQDMHPALTGHIGAGRQHIRDVREHAAQGMRPIAEEHVCDLLRGVTRSGIPGDLAVLELKSTVCHDPRPTRAWHLGGDRQGNRDVRELAAHGVRHIAEEHARALLRTVNQGGPHGDHAVLALRGTLCQDMHPTLARHIGDAQGM